MRLIHYPLNWCIEVPQIGVKDVDIVCHPKPSRTDIDTEFEGFGVIHAEVSFDLIFLAAPPCWKFVLYFVFKGFNNISSQSLINVVYLCRKYQLFDGGGSGCNFEDAVTLVDIISRWREKNRYPSLMCFIIVHLEFVPYQYLHSQRHPEVKKTWDFHFFIPFTMLTYEWVRDLKRKRIGWFSIYGSISTF